MADYDFTKGDITQFGIANQGNNPKTIWKMFDFEKDFVGAASKPSSLAIGDTVQLLTLPPHCILLAANRQVIIPTKTASAAFDLGWTADPDGLGAGVDATAAGQVTVDNTDLVLQGTGTKILLTVTALSAAITPPFRMAVQLVVFSFEKFNADSVYGN